ncbi:MAG: hypothetical protein JO019_05085 [Candidatus Kaiserbacteria bacterium]|nr:hypothetical protein [Candidatus Kaiserbacteria bacterium]
MNLEGKRRKKTIEKVARVALLASMLNAAAADGHPAGMNNTLRNLEGPKIAEIEKPAAKDKPTEDA